jgi:urate oxidase
MQLEGNFNESFETGNNRQLVPTDTMKNSLYAYAKKFNIDCLEVSK